MTAARKFWRKIKRWFTPQYQKDLERINKKLDRIIEELKK